MAVQDFAREVLERALAARAPRLIRLAALAEAPAPQRDALMHRVYGLDELDAAAKRRTRHHAE